MPPLHIHPARLCGRLLKGPCVKGTVKKHKAVSWKLNYLHQYSAWRSLMGVSSPRLCDNGIQFNLLLKLHLTQRKSASIQRLERFRELKSDKAKLSSIKLRKQNMIYGEEPVCFCKDMNLENQLALLQEVSKYEGWSDPEKGVCLDFLKSVCRYLHQRP